MNIIIECQYLWDFFLLHQKYCFRHHETWEKILKLNFNRAAPWRKRLVSSLQTLRTLVRVSVIYSMWVSWWTKQGLASFSKAFLPFSSTTNFIPQFLHAHLIHFVSFNFISPCDCATGVVGRHSCCSLTLNIVSSSHITPRYGPMSDRNCGDFKF